MVKLKISEKSVDYLKRPAGLNDSDVDQFFTSGLGERINIAIELIGTREKVSDLIGTSPASLYRYITEVNMPPFDLAAKLCAAAGVRMEWLATGQEPKVIPRNTPSSAFVEPLRQVVIAVEQALQEADRVMSAEKKADLIAAVYELFTSTEGDLPNELVLKLVRAAV